MCEKCWSFAERSIWQFFFICPKTSNGNSMFLYASSPLKHQTKLCSFKKWIICEESDTRNQFTKKSMNSSSSPKIYWVCYFIDLLHMITNTKKLTTHIVFYTIRLLWVTYTRPVYVECNTSKFCVLHFLSSSRWSGFRFWLSLVNKKKHFSLSRGHVQSSLFPSAGTKLSQQSSKQARISCQQKPVYCKDYDGRLWGGAIRQHKVSQMARPGSHIGRH